VRTIALDTLAIYSCDPGELCQKGYARVNEFEAHENSYDHQHKKVRHSFPPSARFAPVLYHSTSFLAPSLGINSFQDQLLQSALPQLELNGLQRLKDMKAMTRQPPSGVKRKSEKSDMVSINLQPTESAPRGPHSSAKKSATRPIGWPAPSQTSEPKAETATAAEEGAPQLKSKPEEERWEERPLAWEELEQADDLVDLVTMRPPGVQKIVDAHRDHMSRRRDHAAHNDIWSQVEDIRSRWVT